MDAKVWKFNAARGMNGAGYVFLVLAVIMAAITMSHTDKPGDMPVGERIAFVCVPLAIISVLLILRRVEMVYSPDAGTVKLGKGFLPFITWREISVSGKKSVVLSASRVKGTPIFECNLFFESTEEKFPLIGSGSSKDLKGCIDFARAVGAEVVVEPSMAAIGGHWLKQYLPEYKG